MYSGNQASYDNLSENMKQKLEGLKTPIVNDLTTGGSDKALSAESGKELKSLVDEKADSEDLKYLQTEVTEHLAEIATTEKLGHIKPDGVTLEVDPATGVASAKTSGGLPYGVGTTTDGTNYSVNIEGITSYTAGMAIAVMPETNNTGAVYINVNGLGSKRAMYQTSVFVNSPDSFKYGIVYVFIYNGGTFVMQGMPIQLNNTLTSTSTVEVATANTVKQVNDKLIDRLDSTNVVIGNLATINLNKGESSIAIGKGAKCVTGYTVAVGTGSEASAPLTSNNGWSCAFGPNAKATEYGAGVFGESASNPNSMSIVIGRGATAVKIPGNFSVAGTKQFEIPHPKPEKAHTHVIRHGAVESPTTGDTLYRYCVDVKGDIAEVQMAGSDKKITLPVNRSEDSVSVSIPLPDYWVHLNINEQVFISPDRHFSNGYGFVDRDNESLELTFKETKKYNVVVFGTRNDSHEAIQTWNIKGVEREVGESWLGETYVFEVEEIAESTEFKEVVQ